VNELAQLVSLAGRAAESEPLALATVVHVQGSAYRRPGARMLVTGSGLTTGMISGGCLEEDVREHALQVIAADTPRLLTYDSTSRKDLVFGMGQGCNGIVQILVEPLSRDPSGLLAFFRACLNERIVGRIATVFSVQRNGSGCSMGNRLLQWPDGHLTSDLPPMALAAFERALLDFPDRRATIRSVDLENGTSATALFESIIPLPPVVVIGGGEDTTPLIRLAKELGRHVTVVDTRPAYAQASRFPQADAVIWVQEKAPGSLYEMELASGTQVVIKTHHFARDKRWLHFALRKDLSYVGILGPRSRTERLLRELADEGIRFSEEQLAHLHSPAGLDIGAETPEEIALSILSEMQASLTQRRGSSLRERRGPIHDPADTSAVSTAIPVAIGKLEGEAVNPS